MSRTARAVLGALIGALVALYAHPYSRTRLLTPLAFWGPCKELSSAPELLSHLDVLPQPKSIEDYSLWMEAGARRILDRYPTKPREWKNLIAAAVRASQLDPSNAFWDQMQASFAMEAKERDTARLAWRMAANKSSWDDGQTSRLKRVRQTLLDRYGAGSWTAIGVYPLRSVAPSQCIEHFARDIAKTTMMRSQNDLRLRLATLRNGKLMRDGARSMRVSEVGIAIIELASYTGTLSSINSPRKLLLARTEFYSALAQQLSQVAADEADRAFRDNDSWLGYPTSVEAAGDAQEFAIFAGISNGSTSILLVTSLLGITAQLLSRALRTTRLRALLTPPWVGIVGIALSLFAFFDTQLSVLAVAAVASFGFLAFVPSRERTRHDLDFGPLHSVLIGVITFLLVAAVALGLASGLVVGHVVTRSSGLPQEVLAASDPAAAAFTLALSTLAVISAFYGLSQKVPPNAVFTSSLRKVGLVMAWGGVAFAIFSAPFLLWLDRHTDLVGTQRLENEPVYYYFEG